MNTFGQLETPRRLLGDCWWAGCFIHHDHPRSRPVVICQWVAEVCVARKVGREVKAYKDKKDTVLELRRKRAEAKMYNEVIHECKGCCRDCCAYTVLLLRSS